MFHACNPARRYAKRNEPLEELEQVGALGLLKAIERYDPSLGYHFLAFAASEFVLYRWTTHSKPNSTSKAMATSQRHLHRSEPHPRRGRQPGALPDSECEVAAVQ
jgi:hypothetical protein